MSQTAAVLNNIAVLYIPEQEERSAAPSSGRETRSWYHTHCVICQTENTGWLQGQQKKAYPWKMSWNLFLLLDDAAADVCSFIFA